MLKKTLLLLTATVILGGLTSWARTTNIEGAEAVTLVEIGQQAPEFKLFGVDLRYHSLSMYQDKKAIAVIFHCNHCPISRRNVDRIVELGNEYQDKDVQFLVINPNPVDKVEADGFEQMRKRAEEKDFPFPYLYDETQAVSFEYGARRTDHVFILGEAAPDGSRQVEFIGPVDDRGNEPIYLADKLDTLLAGEEIENPEVSAFGCTIKYRTAEERINRFGYDIFEE